ncbi:SixA phosphatase family protein [Microterricola viridarii]|uniref:Phosphohistidine phosphatase n=1 Tax=Microterricola viridarii TaxID=412690 RepID=A0A1H1NZR6_9MICO|nr:histidine phosphatase family protein [Microterricola viridarii]SDS04270.1 phosphohistidine phosphatase [Microterricola viridarii]
MKTLILVRHAKSSWDEPSLVDEARPLNKRGRHDAPEMGRRLLARGVVPETILASPAVRARTTAELIALEIGAEDAVVIDHRLYATSASGMLAVIREQDDAIDSLMVVGHDPEMSDLAHRFSPLSPPMVTCAVLELQFDRDSWTGIEPSGLSSKHFDSPKAGEKAGVGAEAHAGAGAEQAPRPGSRAD